MVDSHTTDGNDDGGYDRVDDNNCNCVGFSRAEHCPAEKCCFGKRFYQSTKGEQQLNKNTTIISV